MTQQEINAQRPADKLAHPERYCRKDGCLLWAIGKEGYCARHETPDYVTALSERRDYQCPSRD